MLRCDNYIFASSIEDAYQLNQKKNNVIVAGNGWLKMGSKNWSTVIDISKLDLDTIEETDSQFKIGAMVTLRNIEKHSGLNAYTNDAIKESVKHIVGTQFRNSVTVGGSIYGRFGFSDVLTVFLAMDSYVEMYKSGIIPLNEFAKMSYDKDILVSVIVKKTPLNIAYCSFRNQSTDFPVLSCAVSVGNSNAKAVIGARPARAFAIKDSENILSDLNSVNIDKFASWAADKFDYDTNIRASAEYRRYIAKVLINRALQNILESR